MADGAAAHGVLYNGAELGPGERDVLVHHLRQQYPASTARVLAEWAIAVVGFVGVLLPPLLVLRRERRKRAVRNG